MHIEKLPAQNNGAYSFRNDMKYSNETSHTFSAEAFIADQDVFPEDRPQQKTKSHSASEFSTAVGAGNEKACEQTVCNDENLYYLIPFLSEMALKYSKANQLVNQIGNLSC